MPGHDPPTFPLDVAISARNSRGAAAEVVVAVGGSTDGIRPIPGRWGTAVRNVRREKGGQCRVHGLDVGRNARILDKLDARLDASVAVGPWA